ncbi:MAG TPA: hypothetical protein PK987_03310 [Ferruginibacter sp.]|nr:hypothetical protein [Ferruginibacter sp.]
MKRKSIFTRNFLVLILVIICYKSSFAQLQEIEASKPNWVTVGELKWMSNIKASLKYFVNGNDTTCLLYLQDIVKLKNNNDMTVYQYFSIRFSGVDNTMGKLYDLLISFFDQQNKKNKQYEKRFRLGDEMVLVRHFQKITSKAIVLATSKNSIVLSKNEVDKLFGR